MPPGLHPIGRVGKATGGIEVGSALQGFPGQLQPGITAIAENDIGAQRHRIGQSKTRRRLGTRQAREEAQLIQPCRERRPRQETVGTGERLHFTDRRKIGRSGQPGMETRQPQVVQHPFGSHLQHERPERQRRQQRIERGQEELDVTEPRLHVHRRRDGRFTVHGESRRIGRQRGRERRVAGIQPQGIEPHGGRIHRKRGFAPVDRQARTFGQRQRTQPSRHLTSSVINRVEPQRQILNFYERSIETLTGGMAFQSINDTRIIDADLPGHDRPQSRRRFGHGSRGCGGCRHDNGGIGKHRHAAALQRKALHIDPLPGQVDRGAKSLHGMSSGREE